MSDLNMTLDEHAVAELYGEDGREHGGRMEPPRWSKPGDAVRHGEYLFWQEIAGRYLMPEVVAWPREAAKQSLAFEQFLDLGEDIADLEEFNRKAALFAQAWGPIGICPHVKVRRSCEECSREVDCPPYGADVLAFWHVYAVLARQLMALAGRSRSDGPLSATDRRTIETSVRASILLGPSIDAGTISPSSEQLVGLVIDRWLSVAGVRLRFSWTQARPALEIDPGPTVLGVLGLHLATVLARSDGMWICDGCGVPHFRARAPKTGHPCYCTRLECKRLQNRQAQQRSRDRRKDANDD